MFEEQIDLLIDKLEINKFIDSTRPKIQNEKEEKSLTYEKAKELLQGRQKVVNVFENKRFPIKKQPMAHILKC